MKFKKLTDKDKNYIKKVYLSNSLNWTEKMSTLSDYIGKSPRTVRSWVKKLELTTKEESESPELKKAKSRSFDKRKTKFLVTWAQNDTPVHLQFFKNMEAYAKSIDADIHVIAGRYKNPTSVFDDKKHDIWSELVTPYLDAARHDLHKYLSIMSDVKIQPTAVNPMTGMQALSGVNSCVFGSPKVQLEMIPVLENAKPKMMLTTGACTLKNYTDSKAGKKGEFHHTLGFVIVEIEDKDTFYVRHVTADDNGDFCDLYNEIKFNGETEPIKFENPLDKIDWVSRNCGAKVVKLKGKHSVKKIKKIEACILGDLHSGHHDQDVVNSTHKMLSKIKPNHVILHDVFDGASISHHKMKDPIAQYAMEYHNTNDLGKELDEMYDLLNEFNKYDNVVIVRSNHDDFIDRWVKLQDWKKQPTPKNGKLYSKFMQIMMEEVETNPENIKGVIPHLISEKFPKFKTLGRKDSYRVLDWELGQHGDIGSNGSRGSLVQFRKLNTKIVVGHYHCLPSKYKVQTLNSGWKEIRSIKEGDIILSYDVESGNNVWVNVDEFIETNYNGTMLQIKGNGFEQTFTDKHMLMLSDGSYIPASEAICSRSASELPLTANYVSDYGIDVPKNIIRKIVAIAADGSQDGYRIRFHLTKTRKIKRLEELFGDDLIKYEKKGGDYDVYISTRSHCYKELMEYKNLKTQKKLSNEILSWSPNSISILEEELRFWDGTFDTGSNGRQWSTTNKVELNVVTSVLNRLGFSLSVNKREYDNPNHNTLYVVTWCKDKNVTKNTNKMSHSKRFNGWGFNSYQANTKVYCVSVPTKCFWIQSPETGDVSLTGNSPGRKDGALAVGTSTHLRVGYNMGPSSWFQTHVIIHKNGKAQHINFIKDKKGVCNFTTLK